MHFCSCRRLYGRALAAAEVAALALQPQHRWVAPASPTGAQVTLEDTASPTYLANDAIGAARNAHLREHAALVGAPSASEQCDAGKPYADMAAACVDGLLFPFGHDPAKWGHAWIDLPVIASADNARLVGGGGFTFAAEVHVAAGEPAASDVTLFHFADASGANSVSLSFGLYGASSPDAQIAAGAAATRATFTVVAGHRRSTLEVWHFLETCGSTRVSNATLDVAPDYCHVAATATGHGGSSLALYRNGGLVQDGVHANPRHGAHVPAADVAYSKGRLGVSRDEDGVAGDHFAGAIRAVRIYRRALPPVAVRKLVSCAPDCLPTKVPTQAPPPAPTTDAPTRHPTVAMEERGWSQDLYKGMVFGILAFIVFGVTIFLLISPCIQLIEGGSGGPPDVDASYYIYSPSILTF